VKFAEACEQLLPADITTVIIASQDITGHLIKNGSIEGRESIVYREGELIQRITSHYASHKQLEQPKFPPTIYTVQMCVFATLDMFLLFKDIVEAT